MAKALFLLDVDTSLHSPYKVEKGLKAIVEIFNTFLTTSVS